MACCGYIVRVVLFYDKFTELKFKDSLIVIKTEYIKIFIKNIKIKTNILQGFRWDETDFRPADSVASASSPLTMNRSSHTS